MARGSALQPKRPWRKNISIMRGEFTQNSLFLVALQKFSCTVFGPKA
jgi:hypothetical protein